MTSHAPGGALLGHDEEVMGTVVSFAIRPGPLGDGRARQVIAEACGSLHRDDRTFSTWMPASPMSRLRSGEIDLHCAGRDIAEVLDTCRTLKDLSRGWFDPWSAPGGVDPTGMVKGWSAERAAGILRSAGVPAGMVNAGGDVYTWGSPSPDRDEPWRIGVRHPWRPDALAGILEVDATVATSGTYERGEHLWNPHAGGAPSSAAVSATVTGPSLAVADALATALAVGGPPLLEVVDSLPGYEAWIIGPLGEESTTSGIRWAPALASGR